jgi:hypothetical protein
MKFLRVFAVCVLLLAGLSVVSAQTWTPVTQAAPIASPGTALLLTDGRVLVHDSDASDWWTLTPDQTGSYINGAWAQAASLPSGYGPLYFASAVLPDGRVVAIGGEYNFGHQDWTNLGAIYTPTTDSWKSLSAPPGWANVGDAQSVVLANGKFMLATALSSKQAILTGVKWNPTGGGKKDGNDEEGWTLLPSGKVLTVDANCSSCLSSEIYDPSAGTWSSAGSTVVELVDLGSHEIGPAVLRPDGTVLATGGSGHNAVYDTATGQWTAAPDFPKSGGQLDVADGPAALLPDGNVLVMTSPGVFNTGSKFFEWDGNKFNATVSIPNAVNDSSYYGRMLVLPTGQILLTDGSPDVEIYTSTGAANPSWAPTITKFVGTLTHGKNSTISGTQFNGLSQGAAYGDDAQAASNYPLVRITNVGSGHVFYARTYKHSSMGVATGSTVVKTHFQVPAGIELGASTLEVVANGIASNPVNVTIK